MSTTSELRQIDTILNRAQLTVHTGPVAAGDLFAGPFVDTNGTTMHRVRVQRLLPKDMVEVSGLILLSQILDGTLPFTVFEKCSCCLKLL